MGRRIGVLDIVIIVALIIIAALIIYYLWWLIVIIILIAIGYYLYKRHKARESRTVV